MINYIYLFDTFIVKPFAFFLLSFNKLQFLNFGFLLSALSGILSLILYLQLDFLKNFDPILTNFIISIFFILVSVRVKEDKTNYDSYNYLRKSIFWGFGLYYLVEHIPILRGLVTFIVALISVLFTRLLLGFNCSLSGIDYAGYNMLFQTYINTIAGNILEVNVPINETSINIVLGCTGVREILLLYFLIKFTNSNIRTKKLTFLISASVILLINIIRNAIVIYLTGYKNFTFETAHHGIGSILIFFALLFVTIFTLFKIPEINTHIENIFGLKKIGDGAKLC